MRKILVGLTILAFTSCVRQKNNDVQFDPNKAYTVKYQTDAQIVKTSVSNDTLHLDLYQKVGLLVDPYDYSHTWALCLIQDFSNSYLKDLHFDTPSNSTSSGYVHDWIPINLNDVAPDQKTTANVTVNGKQYVLVTITRLFKFYNILASNQAAVTKQNELLQAKGDYVKYKAFYSFNNVYSVSNDSDVNLVYQ